VQFQERGEFAFVVSQYVLFRMLFLFGRQLQYLPLIY